MKSHSPDSLETSPTRSAAYELMARGLAAIRKQSVIKSRIQSMLHLLSGGFGVAAIMLGSLSLAARTLGPDQFGELALILTIGRVCERLLRFESWQPLVRYIAAEENSGNPSQLSRLYAFGLMLDISTAALAASLCVLVGWLMGGLVGLEDEDIGLVAIYAIAILFNVRGASSAALRMSGRFKTMAYIQGPSAMLRFVIAAMLFMADASLMAFVIAWTLCQIADACLFNVLGFGALKEQGIPNPLTAKWKGLRSDFPGFLGFAFSTNISSTLRTLTHETDTLLVGMFAGAGSAGLYHISKRIAKVAQQAGDMIQTVIYPDLARMWSRDQNGGLGKMVKWLQLVLALLGASAVAAVWLFGQFALNLVLGPGYSDAYPLLLAQLVAVALVLHATPSRSALLAMNRPTYVLGVASLATAIFFAVALTALPVYGALGANYAHIAFGLSTAVLLDIAMWWQLSKRRSAPQRAAIKDEADGRD